MTSNPSKFDRDCHDWDEYGKERKRAEQDVLEPMTWQQYVVAARETWDGTVINREEYVSMKLVEEVGELVGSFAKEKFHGKPNNNIEELGDIFWYIANSIISEKKMLNLEKSEECDSKGLIDDLQRMVYFANLSWINITDGNPKTRFNGCIFAINTLAHSICSHLELNPSDVWKANIAKLRKRHGRTYNRKFYLGDNQ